MSIYLEILESAYVHAEQEITALNAKELVPKMIIRRRLTRAAKIAIFLADKVHFTQGRIVYGSSFGELSATASILTSIADKTAISPTHFQNSVYNTAVSYLSMLNGNENEIMTISSGDNTASNVLKSGAVKALDGDTLLLMVTETLNIDNIDQVNNCVDFLEGGVALKVKVTEETPTFKLSEGGEESLKLPKSLLKMLEIAKYQENNPKTIIEVSL